MLTRAKIRKLSLEEQLALAATGTKQERSVLACYSQYVEVNDLLQKDEVRSVRVTARVNDPRLSGLGDSSSAAAAVISATFL
jgi:galactokinase/mevalonate kinase-like predicted kinase